MRRYGVTLMAALVCSAAHADLKLVQKTVMEGELGKQAQKQNKPSPSTTTYYKGNRMRTEAGDAVTIFDGERTLLLNPKKKTYQVLPKDMAANLMASPMMAMMDIKTDVSVKPTGKTQTIQGKKASQYVMTMTMKIGMKQGTEGAPKNAEIPKIPPITSTTELWTAEFPGINLAPGTARQTIPAGAAGMGFVKDLVEKMKSVKGIPLQTTSRQELMGRKLNMTVKTVALSEAPLADSLFSPPVGFKQVPYEAPAMPMMPMGGGGR